MLLFSTNPNCHTSLQNQCFFLCFLGKINSDLYRSSLKQLSESMIRKNTSGSWSGGVVLGHDFPERDVTAGHGSVGERGGAICGCHDTVWAMG